MPPIEVKTSATAVNNGAAKFIAYPSPKTTPVKIPAINANLPTAIIGTEANDEIAFAIPLKTPSINVPIPCPNFPNKLKRPSKNPYTVFPSPAKNPITFCPIELVAPAIPSVTPPADPPTASATSPITPFFPKNFPNNLANPNFVNFPNPFANIAGIYMSPFPSDRNPLF